MKELRKGNWLIWPKLPFSEPFNSRSLGFDNWSSFEVTVSEMSLHLFFICINYWLDLLIVLLNWNKVAVSKKEWDWGNKAVEPLKCNSVCGRVDGTTSVRCDGIGPDGSRDFSISGFSKPLTKRLEISFHNYWKEVKKKRKKIIKK